MQCAGLFLEGAKLGRMYVSQAQFLDEKHAGTKQRRRMLFLRKLTKYYQPGVGEKYLAYGQLLRPIRFLEPDPMPTSSYQETYRMKWTVTRPSLMSAAFLAPDRSLGVFLINISDEPITYRFELTPGKYPVEKSRRYRLSSVNADGERSGQGEPQKGTIAAAGEIRGRDVVFLEAQCDERTAEE